MGIEWYRDLSITLMGFAATAAFIFTVILIIFVTIMCYLLYRKIAGMLLLGKTLLTSVNGTVKTVEETIKTTSQNINDTITEVKDSITKVSKGIGDTIAGIQESIKPLMPALAVIRGVTEGIKSIREIFKKETN